MAVQFKFRSSLNFDSVDIDGRTSISVRDLKSKIIRHKNICQDSDLVFSDPVTCQEYNDESIRIPCGSSVIIKRVPAGTVHVDMPQFNSADVKSLVSQNAETVDFDDFGVDLYPVPEATFFSSDLDAHKDACVRDYEPNTDIARYPDPAVGRCQKLEASGVSDAIPEGHARSAVEHEIPQAKSKHEEEDLNLEKIVTVNPLDTQHANMTSELKCSLCNSFFKEAMMIPCCQHSFCEKCIRQVLLQKARCPKCFSTKCRVEDLLPNISLRQAIEHFLESQNLVSGPNGDFCQYAPDGESGIQAKDVSCGGTILQRESEWPHSPETRMGSNHFFGESAYNSTLKKDASNHLGANNFLKRHGSTRLGPDGLAAFDDFQGESRPMHEQVESTIKKKRPPWVSAAGDKSFFGTGQLRKGERTCYMCGSPDHFIRDCPVASTPQPMFHAGNAIFPGAMPGYGPPYWNGVPLPRALPFRNMYGNHVMTAFDTRPVPPAPFAVPTYMPSMYSSFPAFGGHMGMRGVTPHLGTGEDCYSSRPEFLDLQGRGKRRKFSNDSSRRERSDDDDDKDRDSSERRHHKGTERLHDHKSCINREKSTSYSEDSSTKGPQRQSRHHNHTDDEILSVDGRRKSSRFVVSGRDQKLYHRMEISNPEVDDMPSSSSCRSEEKHKHYHRSSRKHRERKEQSGSDSSRNHHQNKSMKDDNRKWIERDFKRQNLKHHSCSGSGLEQSASSDKKLRKESSHTSRHPKYNVKSDEPRHDRWAMVSGSDEDDVEGYQYCRQKRKD